MTGGFYNDNEFRAFPFVTDTVGRPADGPTTLRNLPNPTIVDLGFLLGPHSGFDPADHQVYLASLSRSGSTFTFEFRATSPELFGIPLTFVRVVGDPEYAGDFSDTADEGLSASSLSGSSSSSSAALTLCEGPLWEGYLVTGDLAVLDLWLPGDGAVLADDGDALVEPSCLQSLWKSLAARVGVANADRTLAQAADGCPPLEYPDRTDHYVAAACLTGPILVAAGYNATVRQLTADNQLVLGAAPGAGLGLPCVELPLFPGESPPDGSSRLSGGPDCSQVLRTLVGQPGPRLALTGGGGVTIENQPETSTINVNIDLVDGLTCP